MKFFKDNISFAIAIFGFLGCPTINDLLCKKPFLTTLNVQVLGIRLWIIFMIIIAIIYLACKIKKLDRTDMSKYIKVTKKDGTQAILTSYNRSFSEREGYKIETPTQKEIEKFFPEERKGFLNRTINNIIYYFQKIKKVFNRYERKIIWYVVIIGFTISFFCLAILFKRVYFNH
jgi:hypothetical protein